MSKDVVHELSGPLVEWIEATADGRVKRIERRHAGGAREGWWVDVERGDCVLELFLRRDAGNGPLSGTRYSLSREGRTIRALQYTGLLVPEVLGIHEQERCTLMRRVPGQADFRRVAGTPEWEQVSRQYVDQICFLHTLDPAKLDLPDHRIPVRAVDYALFEVSDWLAIYRRQVRLREPVVDFGFKWLERHAPQSVQRTVLVHGDAGPANFLFEAGRVTAVLDWDISHVGDPLEDIAGICVRGTWTPFGNLPTYVREYERRSGLRVDFSTVRYYMHLQFMRAAVGELVALEGFDPTTDVTLNTMSLILGMRGMAQVMAQRVGLAREEPRQPPPVPANAATPYFGVLAQNAEVLLAPALADPYLAHRARQLATLARCLERAAALRPLLEAQEKTEIEQLLARSFADLTEAEAELTAHIEARSDGSERDLIDYLCRRCERRTAIWAPALGPLYYNPQPDLEAL